MNDKWDLRFLERDYRQMEQGSGSWGRLCHRLAGQKSLPSIQRTPHGSRGSSRSTGSTRSDLMYHAEANAIVQCLTRNLPVDATIYCTFTVSMAIAIVGQVFLESFRVNWGPETSTGPRASRNHRPSSVRRGSPGRCSADTRWNTSSDWPECRDLRKIFRWSREL